MNIDSQSLVTGVSMACIVALLFAWQLRGDPARCRAWLGYGASFLDLLAAGLALSWAVMQGAGLLTILFSAGFIGLALSKATTAGAMVSAYRAGNTSAVVVGGLTLIGVYSVIYLAGVFGGTHDSVEKQALAAQASAPVKAVEAQLETARIRLEGLAGFADSGKARADTALQQAARDFHESRTADLRAELAAAEAALQACDPSHKTRCIAPAQAEIARINSLISSAVAGTTSNGAGEYASRHAEYVGVKAHIADLEAKRAELLSSGGAAVMQAAGADDRLIAWLTGVEAERASGLKWLFFVLAFDILSLGLRIFSELHESGAGERDQAARRYKALLATGMSPHAAAQAMSGNGGGDNENIPPAQVRLNPIQQMDVGGMVLTDGLAHLHAGERVLTVQETAEYEKLKAAWADNSKYYDEFTAKDGKIRSLQQYEKWIAEHPTATPLERECDHCWNGYMCETYGKVDGQPTDYRLNLGGCPHFMLRDGTFPVAKEAGDLNKPVAKEAGDLNKPVATEAGDLDKPVATEASDYEAVGGHDGFIIITCEACGATAKQRALHQRFCPECTAKRKQGVMRSKSRSKAKQESV